MSKGYVYVLSNPSMPGLVKVGRSIDGGKQRARQMFQTGVPQPFELEFEVLTDAHEDVEARAHEALWHKVEYARREFFRVTVQEAIIAVSHAMVKQMDHSVVPSEWEASVVGIAAVGHEIGLGWEDSLNAAEFVSPQALQDGWRVVTDYREARANRRGLN